MKKRKTEHINYDCPSLGKEANLTLVYLYHDPETRFCIEFDCDQKKECGVGIQNRNSWSFNWEACPIKKNFK